MALSALDDATREPTDDDLRDALGDAHAAWTALTDWLGAEAGVDRFEWGNAGRNYGWSLRAIAKNRRIAYLIPRHGSFLVGLVLGSRAMEAARTAVLSDAARETLEGAPRYGEGTGFRLPVAGAADLADVNALVAIKSRL